MTHWFVYTRPDPDARLRLFCFPYSGGGAVLFRSWAESLPAAVALYPVELPGRGSRIAEPLVTRLEPLVHELAQALYPYLDRPFAFFGHSLGALLSFELAHLVRLAYGLQPACLFVSAHRAPQLPNPDPTVHTRSNRDLVAHLHRLDGMPAEALRKPELLRVVLPIIRKDLEVCNTYVYVQREPFGCPLIAFAGSQDSLVGPNDLKPWAAQTTASFSLYVLPGGHLFMNSARHFLLGIVARELQQVLERI